MLLRMQTPQMIPNTTAGKKMITCRCHMSARRNRITSFGAFLLSMFDALICATVIRLDDSSVDSCAAVPLVEGPCTFLPVGDALRSAVSLSPMSVSSCAVASPVGRLAARNRFLTVIFHTQHATADYKETVNID